MQIANSIIFYYLLLSYSNILSVFAVNEQFKINKLNLVWNKAHHSLGLSKLKDLKNDLTKHEVDELTLKKMKSHNQDKEGLFEASVRKKLMTILSKYKLERYYDDIHPTIDSEHDLKRRNLDRTKIESSNTLHELKGAFRDKKLDKLWKKAELSGFTQEELMILHEEFQHQQEKLDEHYDTMNLIEEELVTKARETERTENSIDDETNVKLEKKEESPSEKRIRLDLNANQILKEKYGDIKKNIDQLQKKIASGKVDDKNGPFEEPPVNELWSAAVEGKFTKSELESLKEELQHYEARIKKLKHFQVQLERDEIAGVKKAKSGREDDDETKHLRRRVKELSHSVDKIHISIESKIFNNRDEL